MTERVYLDKVREGIEDEHDTAFILMPDGNYATYPTSQVPETVNVLATTQTRVPTIEDVFK